MESSVNPTEKQEAKQPEITPEQQHSEPSKEAPTASDSAKASDSVEVSSEAKEETTEKTTPIKEAPPTNAPQETDSKEAADLMAASTQKMARPKEYQVGDSVTGTLVKVGEKNAFINIGQKSEATMNLEDVKDKEGNFLEEGTKIKAYVIGFSDGNVELGKRLPAGMDAKIALEDAFESKMPIEGKVTGRNKGGLEVKVFGKRAFCPVSHIELHFCEHPETYIGKTLSFTVLELKEKGKQIVLSRRELLQKEAQVHADALRENLVKGAEFEGKVTSLTDYGAFVDLGSGVEGLVHVSEISHKRVDNPKDALKVHDKVRVQVLKYNPDQNRISLSIKALEQDPWKNVLEFFAEQSVTKGKIVRLENFGAFVELAPGIDGLIHISELSHQRVRHPSDVVNVGDEVDVKIIRNEPEKRRIGLSMKELQEAPVEERKEYNKKRSRSDGNRNKSRSNNNQNQQDQKVFGTLADLLKNVKVKK